MAQGGWRPGAGRKKGSRNKVAVEVRALARVYGPEAIRALVDLLQHTEWQARAMAAKELLDRGYGKPSEERVVRGDQDNPLRTIVEFAIRPIENA